MKRYWVMVGIFVLILSSALGSMFVSKQSAKKFIGEVIQENARKFIFDAILVVGSPVSMDGEPNRQEIEVRLAHMFQRLMAYPMREEDGVVKRVRVGSKILYLSISRPVLFREERLWWKENKTDAEKCRDTHNYWFPTLQRGAVTDMTQEGSVWVRKIKVLRDIGGEEWVPINAVTDVLGG